MKNSSNFFPESLPGDGMFDINNNGELDMFESAVRDSEIFTYWEERENKMTDQFYDDDYDDMDEDDIDDINDAIDDGLSENDNDDFEMYDGENEDGEEFSYENYDNDLTAYGYNSRPQFFTVHDSRSSAGRNTKKTVQVTKEEDDVWCLVNSSCNFKTSMPSLEKINEIANDMAYVLTKAYYGY